MEQVAMECFNGFQLADFQFLYSLDVRYKSILRSRLQLFGETVHKKLPQVIKRSFPGPVFVGRFSGGEYQRPTAIIGRKDLEKGPFKHTNFVLRLEPDGLHINTVIRDGKYGDSKSPITCLARAIDSSPNRFTCLIADLRGDHSVRVFERKPIHGDRIMPGNEMWVPHHRAAAEDFNAEATSSFRKMLEIIKFPGIQIGLFVPRDKVLNVDGDILAQTAVLAISNLYPIIRFAESGAQD